MNLKRYAASAFLLASFSTTPVFAADTFIIDQAHSDVGFSVPHMMISEVEGEFADFTGELVWDVADPSKSSISGSIKTASIDTDNVKRDEHLRGADFFDAPKFPEITFKTKKIEKRGENYVTQGTLTMRGVSKDVEIPFTMSSVIKDPWGNTRVGLNGSVTLNRQEYGLSWNKNLDTGGVVLGNDVKIELKVEAVQKK